MIGTGVEFSIATANVLALDRDLPDMVVEATSSRAERLDAQWHVNGLAVVGLQESRRPEGRYDTMHYTIFASGAQTTRGISHFGCELWLHKSLPFLHHHDDGLSLSLSLWIQACGLFG